MPEPGSARSGALLLAFALACGVACAQPVVTSSAAASAAERAQKETDRTMYWIRVLATTPAPVKTAPAAKASVAAAPAPAATAKPKAPPVSTATAAAASPTPAPVAVAGPAKPAPADFADLPEPSALSSRAADNTAATVAAASAAPPPEVAPGPVADPDPGLIQVKSVQPEFPVTVVERIRKGHVEVRFEVEPGGTVTDATVVDSSSARLNIAATEAVRQWRFKPTSASHTAQVDLVFNVDKRN